jgi:hypothetical protein
MQPVQIEWTFLVNIEVRDGGASLRETDWPKVNDCVGGDVSGGHVVDTTTTTRALEQFDKS